MSDAEPAHKKARQGTNTHGYEQSPVDSLTSFISIALSFAAALEACIESMRARATRAKQLLSSSSESLLSALDGLHATRSQRTRIHFVRLDEKILGERAEEARVNASFLEAAAALCGQCATLPFLRQRAGSLPMILDSLLQSLYAGFMGPCSLITATCGLAPQHFETWAVLFRDCVSACRSEASGQGLSEFTVGAEALNDIDITPRTTTGALAEFVTAEDVALGAAAVLVSVTCGTPGRLSIAYTAKCSTASMIDLVISVCGEVIWQGMVPAARITGRLVCTWPVMGYHGIVVTSDRYLVVSQYYPQKLQVYRIDDAERAELELLDIVGTFRSRPVEPDVAAETHTLMLPMKMCLVPGSGQLLGMLTALLTLLGYLMGIAPFGYSSYSTLAVATAAAPVCVHGIERRRARAEVAQPQA